jgi:predicted enzyme related to lactoylglutathione lyase
LGSRAAPSKKTARPALPFVQLDYLYTPSRDVAKDVRFFTAVLGGRLAFAIDAMGARVAKIELTAGPPHVLLTDHLEGDRSVLVYRVKDLDAAVEELKGRGWKKGRAVEIPTGPCFSFTSPGGHRIAVYELSRPGVAGHFEGRKDF